MDVTLAAAEQPVLAMAVHPESGVERILNLSRGAAHDHAASGGVFGLDGQPEPPECPLDRAEVVRRPMRLAESDGDVDRGGGIDVADADRTLFGRAPRSFQPHMGGGHQR